ncbi:hypothetical protein AAFF_G00127350 [Aldrovandia affinis]|uniref:Uncharacterized protein n=1 Tax=Aldrovandia affinis TaxID=143900 RepID=A0AAD7R5H8_9TELE|nr:hypothetical protein AAFF_G00348440 [Aldrovandia affinis]KAJ8366866.1 hypothetical protein AAFF_G00338600 [Aldrovandia affinis]KAJ8409983.1 hypothetical protein AAFF_G00210240 [Aldrovandia affinis]KAJ8412399.1 hypothetical protein AAFF_G00127350 [Aldrovandia affinis]
MRPRFMKLIETHEEVESVTTVGVGVIGCVSVLSFRLKLNLSLGLRFPSVVTRDDLVREQRADPVLKDLFKQLLSEEEVESDVAGYYLQDQLLGAAVRRGDLIGIMQHSCVKLI